MQITLYRRESGDLQYVDINPHIVMYPYRADTMQTEFG